jgi:hypothetical protein
VHNNRGNQTEDITRSSYNTDLDVVTSDAELKALVTQLETAIPAEIVSLTFRDSLRSDLIDIQAKGSIKD